VVADSAHLPVVTPTLEERVAALELAQTTLRSDLTATQTILQTTRTQANSAITALQDRVTLLESGRTALVSRVDTLTADLASAQATIGARVATVEVDLEQTRQQAVAFAQQTNDRFALVQQSVLDAREWARGITDDLRSLYDRLNEWRARLEQALRRGEVTAQGHMTILDAVGRELGVDPRAFRAVIKRLVSDLREQR
jgi:chromosome segregation ATPase